MLPRLKHAGNHEDAVASQTEAPVRKPVRSKVPSRRSSGLRIFSSSTSKAEIQTPPQKRWEAEYLKDLRSNRPARPGGSRPLPDRATIVASESYARTTSAMSCRPSCPASQTLVASAGQKERSTSAMSHRRAHSEMPHSNTTNKCEVMPLTAPPEADNPSKDSSTSTASVDAASNAPDLAYRVSGMRWMEKQEARSLREALEEMDLQDDSKLTAAAQQEASKLVWQHRNKEEPSKPTQRSHNYKEHLEEGAHARSQSRGWYGSIGKHGIFVSGRRSTSSNSNSSKDDYEPVQMDHARSFAPGNQMGSGISDQDEIKIHPLWDSSGRKAYTGLASSISSKEARRRRRSSGPRARDVSDGLFRNPDDKIYEEPEETKAGRGNVQRRDPGISGPLAAKPRNTISKMQTASQPLLRARDFATEHKPRIHRSEIHRNPPSQSRDPSYLKNESFSQSYDTVDAKHDELRREMPLSKNGKEVRSDEIRAATSMRMKDRSPKLPSPTVVSDRPERAIVSFERDWKPKDSSKQTSYRGNRPSGPPDRLRTKPQMLLSRNSAPVVPTLHKSEPPPIHVSSAPVNVHSSTPSIFEPEVLAPAIIPTETPSQSRTRPLPAQANRPLPRHSSTTPIHSSIPHWSASGQRATAQCAACALPIAGRIVSAASHRFHPHCFTCHHCTELLECVAFYPEPDNKRAERLARIEARFHDELSVEEKPGETAQDDGDSSLRFYCHLDFHELYSPRCRSCKTPIESEVIVAAGGSWHVGHFFCAECGDPFDAKTPFVEKDGYAWCVRCHAGRFSGKCRGCRRPVIESGVNALGAEWHEHCFVCVECGGGFKDGRFFTRGEEVKPVCVNCEERRLKA